MSEINLTDQRPRGEQPKKRPADPQAMVAIQKIIADFAAKHGVVLKPKKDEQP